MATTNAVQKVITLQCLVVSVSTQSLYVMMRYWDLDNMNNMLKLVADANLTHMIDHEPGPYTLFAPTDDAIAQLPREALERILDDKQFLVHLLKYHMVNGRIYSHQMSNDMTVPSLYQSGKPLEVRFNIQARTGDFSAEGSWLRRRDNNATNGVLHIIDNVMYPFPEHNIPQLLTQQKGRFATLLAAVKNTSSLQILEGGPFTLFAPTEKAFLNLGYDFREKLFANVTALRDVLNYHLIGETRWKTSFFYDDLVNTVYGRNVEVKTRYEGSGLFTVNGVNIEEADIPITNGVIHQIGAVLIPPDFKL